MSTDWPFEVEATESEDVVAQRVAFVSVAQQFNTATSMGRLVLHILLSFAQFEREMIAERAEDNLITHQEIVESAPVDGSETAVIEKHTTIEKREGDDVDLDVGDGGVVSSTVDLTGEVLALPLKLVAGGFDLVF